jgi:UDP-galactopyranose mutase
VKRLREDVSIYLAIDDRTLTVTGLPVKGELKAEQKLLGKVDKLICVSESLADTLRSRAPSGHTLPIHVLPNGYDERLFDPEVECHEPAFLKNIPRPRLLVSGHISERIDWDGIAQAAQLRPQWNWVFVGPADAGMAKKILNMLGKRGFCHPQIALADVPAWIRHCDACAVPYRLNDFTRASSPLKAIEYLAMGAPVVSTRVPSLGLYGDEILWVGENDGTSYAKALDKCIDVEASAGRRQARMHATANESWKIKAGHFRKMVLCENA